METAVLLVEGQARWVWRSERGYCVTYSLSNL